MCDTWTPTVRSLMNSRWPISLLVSPSATAASTSRSRRGQRGQLVARLGGPGAAAAASSASLGQGHPRPGAAHPVISAASGSRAHLAGQRHRARLPRQLVGLASRLPAVSALRRASDASACRSREYAAG